MPRNDQDKGSPNASHPSKKIKLDEEAQAEVRNAPSTTTVASCSSMVSPSPVTRLGVVTWNVAHFGDGGLSLRKPLEQVFARNEEFAKESGVDSLAAGMTGWTDHFVQWRVSFGEAEAADPLLAAKGESARKKLEKAVDRHLSGATGDDGGDPGEERDPEDTDEDEPESLAVQLSICWKTIYDQSPAPAELQQLWGTYYQGAVEAHRVALESFQSHWTVYRKDDDDSIWAGVHADTAALTSAVKELRLASKMVVKPLLQLREAVNLAHKVQGSAESGYPGNGAAARDLGLAREALDEARRASTWKLSTLLTRIVTLDQCLHRVLIAVHVAYMFASNPWLDVVLLQEVNQGIDDLTSFLDREGLVCVRGFRFKSTSGKGSQIEYYPIVYRKEKGRVVGVDSLWAIYNDSGLVDTRNMEAELTWNKSENVFRPVVGYDVWVRTSTGDKRFVRLGNVHTSPAGSEFSRPDVFAQIEGPLSILSTSSIPVVVGGDFYLTAEAVTRTWGSLTKDEKQQASQLKASFAETLHKRLQEIDQQIEGAKSQQQTVELQAQRRRISDTMEALGTDQIQLLRNDEGARLSVAKKIEAMNLFSEQPLTGTNWKTRGVYQWYDGQIADFFVRSGLRKDDWMDARVGLVHPGGGLRVYDSTMLLAKYWRYCSDHFPVGLVLSTRSNDQELRVPFDTQSALLSWTPTPYTAAARPATDLLGIVNNGFQCYANAALQLVARLDLEAYLQPQGQLDMGYADLRQEVVGILQTRRDEGQEGTYVAYGRYHRYTTAQTIGLRNELVNRGAAQTQYTQEDSGEALVQILQAFDKRVDAFDPGIAGDLRQAVEDDDFVAKRPSSFHFVLRVETRYTLGAAAGPPQGGIVRVDGEGRHYSYRCDNFLRIRLPDAESAEENPTLTALLEATWNVDYQDEAPQAVDTAEHHYPNAVRARETITQVGPAPAHWLVLLERFYFDPLSGQGQKKGQTVDIPLVLQGKNLRGFIEHIGGHAHEGHYVAYVHHDDQWFRLDDTQVIPVADLSAALPRAYVLYYE